MITKQELNKLIEVNTLNNIAYQKEIDNLDALDAKIAQFKEIAQLTTYREALEGMQKHANDELQAGLKAVEDEPKRELGEV